MKKHGLLFLLAAVLAAPCAAAQAAIKVMITCNDQMTYNTRGFEVIVGQRVTLTLKNVGKIPLKAMGHNLVILKPGTPVPVFAGKAHAEKNNNYIPRDAESRQQMLAHTRLLGGGDSDTITFTATEPGAYPFICSSPGHFSIMQGVMTVRAKEQVVREKEMVN
jgi:azurin